MKLHISRQTFKKGEGLSYRTRLNYPFGSWSPEPLEALLRAGSSRYTADKEA